MPFISVIIPALNEAENIVTTINAARRAYTADQIEIIVVDGGSHDGTVDLISPDIQVIQAPRGRAVQMNLGAEASKGELLVFCHADSQLPSSWREVVIDALKDPGVSGGTFQTKILPATGFFIWRNTWVMPVNWKIMYGDQVQFMRRTAYDQVGGFPDLPLMEDVEMSRALNHIGKLVRIDPSFRVITSSRRFMERGLIRQSLQNAVNMIRYLYFGATPEDIAKSYRSSREKE
ncbi:MAG: glycosyltransferase [Anaerolineales bacterium]|nr:MAG: glycosyltransferase [Anaerolineales bacterium]